MSLSRSFEEFKEEIELSIAQNGGVEIDLYSIIASIVRESNNNCEVSVRDVSSRRTSNISKKYKSDSGFPDFIILERKKVEPYKIYGCIEIKKIGKKFSECDKHQIKNHLKKFGKLLYTNGLIWIFFNNTIDNDVFKVELGTIDHNKIIWNNDSKWHDLLKFIDEIEWYKK